MRISVNGKEEMANIKWKTRKIKKGPIYARGRKTVVRKNLNTRNSYRQRVQFDVCMIKRTK